MSIAIDTTARNTIQITLLDYIAKGAFRKYITTIEANPNVLVGLITIIVKNIGRVGFTSARANHALYAIRSKPSLYSHFDTNDLNNALIIAKDQYNNNYHPIVVTLQDIIKECGMTV